jgi:hypothetical protein
VKSVLIYETSDLLCIFEFAKVVLEMPSIKISSCPVCKKIVCNSVLASITFCSNNHGIGNDKGIHSLIPISSFLNGVEISHYTPK